MEKIKDTNKFPATRAEIKPLLDDNVKIPRFVEEWDRTARLQIENTAALQLEGPVKPKLSYEELRAKYDGPNGEKWGIEGPDRAQLTPHKARSALIEKYGQAAFDAVPNARVSMDQLGVHVPPAEAAE